MFAATITPKSVNILIDGRMRTIDSTHANFAKVCETLKEISRVGGWDSPAAVNYRNDIRDWCDIRSFIARVTEGKVQISDNEVRYKGKAVGGVIATRLIELLKGGHDIKPLARFLERVMANPEQRAQTDLYAWLEVAKMPITPDGYFLAWKYVNTDYTSRYDGVTLNRIGDKPFVPREQCDSDPYNECSRGLHFCAFGYLSTRGSNERTMLVKVNPTDVVAIPMDYHRMKGRAWTYEIVAEVPREEAEQFFNNRPLVDDYDDGDAGHCVAEETTTPEQDFDDTDEQDLFYDDDGLPDTRDAQAAEDGVEAELEAIETDDAETAADIHDAADAATGDALPAAKPRTVFEHNGSRHTRKKLRRLLKMFGQRGTARMTGIPRTTLQEWKDEINSPD